MNENNWSLDFLPELNVDTPSIAIDYSKLVKNIKWMQQKADSFKVKLRPHAKTHKCYEIAKLQLDHGAVGITCAKPSEAIEFLQKGVKNITIAYPVVVATKVYNLLQKINSNFSTDFQLNMIVDSKYGVDILTEASEKFSFPIGIFIKIDVGLGRVGLKESDPKIEELAQFISSAKFLYFKGLLSHAGHAYAFKSEEQIIAVAKEERDMLLRVKQKLEGKGIQVAEISVGSTPTVVASNDFEGITEIRPGNYVFMDRTQLSKRFSSVLDGSLNISLYVVATVISTNEEYTIIDSGSKMLSSDLAPHSAEGIVGYGEVFSMENFRERKHPLVLAKLSEEHGWVKNTEGVKSLPIGSKVMIIPNHSCPVANLSEEYIVLGQKDKSITTWEIIARGCVK